jgi:hypothetical protein
MTMPASPRSPIRMATAGCYRNGGTTMCDEEEEFPVVTSKDRNRCGSPH